LAEPPFDNRPRRYHGSDRHQTLRRNSKKLVSKKVPAKNHWKASSPVGIGHSRRNSRTLNPSTAQAKPRPKQITAEIVLMGSILSPLPNGVRP